MRLKSEFVDTEKMSEQEIRSLLVDWRNKIQLKEIDKNQVSIQAYLILLTDLLLKDIVNVD